MKWEFGGGKGPGFIVLALHPAIQQERDEAEVQCTSCHEGPVGFFEGGIYGHEPQRFGVGCEWFNQDIVRQVSGPQEIEYVRRRRGRNAGPLRLAGACVF